MRSRIATLLLVLSFVLVATGCYRHSFRTGAPSRSPFPDAVTSNHHLFWGFANLGGEIHTPQFCPQGTAMVKNYVGPVGVLVSILTAGIWVPVRIEVYCAAGGPPVATERPQTVASE